MQPRGQCLLLQVERPRIDQYRPRNEEPGRAIPRAGSEFGVDMTAGGHGFDGVERRGLMFVLSSPSGAGKTTLSRLLMERTPGLTMSVSVTTRPRRPGEVECRDYLFVDKSKFGKMPERTEWLE